MINLTIYTNLDHCPQEKHYILNTIFTEFWGITFDLKSHNKPYTIIKVDDGKIYIPDVFFQIAESAWANKVSLPSSSAPEWNCSQFSFSKDLVNGVLPVLYSQDGIKDEFLRVESDTIYIHFDLLGACFFMLSGYDEFVSHQKDKFDRFPHQASHAFKNNYLDRPLVNEYLVVLWYCVSHFAPELNKKKRQFQIQISHDVDIPFRYAFSGWEKVAKEMIKALLDKSLLRCLSQPANYYKVKKKHNVQKDPYYTFPLLMDLAEAHGWTLWFYFLVEHHDPMNANYDIQHPLMINLLRNIHQRGHFIGLHGSYHTYRDPDLLHRELDILKNVCRENGIEQAVWGNRQHYLRWHNPTSPQALNQAGFNHDSTVGFAGTSGFKSGTCFDYYLYDLGSRSSTRVREFPLITMEATLLGYNQFDYATVVNKIRDLANICCNFAGNFSLLWHNSSLYNAALVKLYSNIINEL